MDPWATSALTRYSCKDFLSKTTQSRLLLREEKVRQKYLTWNSIRLKFQKKTSIPNRVKNLANAAARIAPDLLKALATLSDITARRSEVDREDLKPYSKAEKWPHFYRWSAVLLLTSFSKTILTTEKRLMGQQFLAVDLSPTFLNTGATDETFQLSGKHKSFSHV